MYLFDNELFAIECVAKYAMEGRVRNSTWEFAHCPEPKPTSQNNRRLSDKGYYLSFEDHQHHGLLQSIDMGRRCFYAIDTKRWLDTKPPGYEELIVIYREFVSGKHNPLFGRVGALNTLSKGVKVIKPDGTKLYFGSIREAARELEMRQNHLSARYLKLGKQPKRGKWEGYQFFYAVKE